MLIRELSRRPRNGLAQTPSAALSTNGGSPSPRACQAREQAVRRAHTSAGLSSSRRLELSDSLVNGHKSLNLLRILGEWCNGSTTDSDSVCLGSNPSSPANVSFKQYRPSPVHLRTARSQVSTGNSI